MTRFTPRKFRWRLLHPRLWSGLWLSLLSCCLVLIGARAIALAPPPQPFSTTAIVQTAETSSGLLDQGRQAYAQGKLAEATQLWRRAAESYEHQGDRLNQSLSLSYLSLAYQGLGQTTPAEQSLTASLNLLKTLDDRDLTTASVLALTLNTQGKLQLALGQTEAALATWETAETTYGQLQDIPGVLGCQINQAQALQTLGLYRRAQNLLTRSRQQLQTQPASSLKIAGLQNLGNTLQILGDLPQSQAVLQESLALAQQLNLPAEISASQFSLGNTLRAAQNFTAALQFYQQAAETAPTLLARLEAQVNQLSLLLDRKNAAEATALQQEIARQFIDLPPSRAGIYVQVNWAATVLRSQQQQSPPTPADSNAVAKQLTLAVQQSRQIQDSRSEAFALGHLGNFHEQRQEWATAQELTQQALRIAQTINAADIAYRWQWQLGRIHQQVGQRTEAIADYTEAVNSLQSLRADLVAMSPDVQFAFRESVEPVYRELVSLLVTSPTPSQAELQQARQAIEGLQQAELENFLRSACLDQNLSDIDKADPTAAIIYPIILKDRLSVIVSLPEQSAQTKSTAKSSDLGKPASKYSPAIRATGTDSSSLQVYTTLLPQGKLETAIEQTLQSMNPLFADEKRLRLSEELYNWLIRPAEAALAQHHVKTLVFVLDGELRSLPMAALYDGQHYLIEKYGVAVTPGLQLLGPQQALETNKFQALIGGLTEARDGFAALPGVAVESQQIASTLPSRVLLNATFTQADLQERLKTLNSPIVHLATHGQFSSNLDQTFILTWDNRLTVEGIKTSLASRAEKNQKPIELLVLSACETAAGDKRAALGLAGIAVRSGARSTLASLWSVNDASTTELMVQFYQALTQPGNNKAESLRKGQLALLKTPQYRHPYYWAPFILVGNWL